MIIDPKGIILTNSHIAQYLLFPDRGVVCRIRTGSPAVTAYSAGLIYLSPDWIAANPTVLKESNPTGTGQYDFALLGITSSVTSTPLPTVFPSISLSSNVLLTGAPVVIATYGAQFLAVNQVQSALSPTIVNGSVKNIYTFDTNSVDVLDLGGSAAAQEGSSGGGVANALGELAGTITTSTVVGDTSTRQLDAITATYIRGEYARETNQTLESLLSQPIATSIANFATTSATLEAALIPHLSQ
jgi:hypothetical protein